ncbi:hypothetical protein [Dyadobacter sp. NIV53]|uniref:hypothetical protein n=1 Tax=Dyadobacter sp. NIV53 TaxID=2861765 RepID=UPI001C8684F0|nr:hypothetical protein [Dyadobacter sp. NIV53]
MKKHIICHYKNGSLLFCTTEGFQPKTAHQILDIFNHQGLTSLLEPKAKNLFQVVGRMFVDYDPFADGTSKWRKVISQMTCTKDALENKLKPFLGEVLSTTR